MSCPHANAEIGDSVSPRITEARDKGFSHELRQHLLALGPSPKESLEMFVDLGLSDGEMARYFKVPDTSISKLCHIWGIRCKSGGSLFDSDHRLFG